MTTDRAAGGTPFHSVHANVEVKQGRARVARTGGRRRCQSEPAGTRSGQLLFAEAMSKGKGTVKCLRVTYTDLGGNRESAARHRHASDHHSAFRVCDLVCSFLGVRSVQQAVLVLLMIRSAHRGGLAGLAVAGIAHVGVRAVGFIAVVGLRETE